MPPLLLRSPSAVSFTRMRSFSILIGSFSPSVVFAIGPTIRSPAMGDDSGRDLHLPASGAADGRAPSCCTPTRGMGGDRHHPLVVALAEGLSAAGVAALRLDLRDPSVPAAAEALADERRGAARRRSASSACSSSATRGARRWWRRTSVDGARGTGPRGPTGHDARPPAAAGAHPRARAGARPVRPARRGRGRAVGVARRDDRGRRRLRPLPRRRHRRASPIGPSTGSPA